MPLNGVFSLEKHCFCVPINIGRSKKFCYTYSQWFCVGDCIELGLVLRRNMSYAKMLRSWLPYFYTDPILPLWSDRSYSHLLLCLCILSTPLCHLAARATPKRLTKQRNWSILWILATPTLPRKEVVGCFYVSLLEKQHYIFILEV